MTTSEWIVLTTYLTGLFVTGVLTTVVFCENGHEDLFDAGPHYLFLPFLWPLVLPAGAAIRLGKAIYRYRSRPKPEKVLEPDGYRGFKEGRVIQVTEIQLTAEQRKALTIPAGSLDNVR
jgi:hypothetical protein